VIFNGPRLLVSPRKGWAALITGTSRSPGWLVAAAVTAAVLPAAAVVGGHLGSAVLGHEEKATAILRAAIGFTSVAGGALVMAPALTLLLITLTRWSRGTTTPRRAAPVAMGILWPVWTAGVILTAPPLLGLGPEVGEIVWSVLAVFIAHRLLSTAVPGELAIRRRWSSYFVLRSTVLFAVLFVVIILGPAMTVRAMLGAATEILAALPERAPLPLPPDPNW
jgi:hypothetical protein